MENHFNHFNILNIPLSLYVHFPWCIQKCPYCDFYSKTDSIIPQKNYFHSLKKDFEESCNLFYPRKIKSIFFGGGTPSLMDVDLLNDFLLFLKPFCENNQNQTEITLEANPGAIEKGNFKNFKEAGINRISLGVQSFNHQILKKIGRIHSAQEAKNALNEIQQNFDNFNIDLMFALPLQTLNDLENDLKTAFLFHPPHLSVYQLTIESGTFFYKNPPKLPDENLTEKMENTIYNLTQNNHYEHYEISAYAKNNFQCQHNLNYWQFGDYLGIGPGAHSKITLKNKKIFRFVRNFNIENYLNHQFIIQKQIPENMALEYLMNAFRLKKWFSFVDFENKTGLKIKTIENNLKKAEEKKLLIIQNNGIQTTDLGRKFLNQLLLFFV